MTDDEGTLWVRTEPTPDGEKYVATLSWGQDRARSMTAEEASAYAGSMLRAAMTATYDAAVARQLQNVLGSDDDPGFVPMLTRLREQRPARPSVPPLTITPGINAELKPFLHLHDGKEAVGQLDVPAAVDHFLAMMIAAIVSDLDQEYYQTLLSFDIDPGLARRSVDGLIEHLAPLMPRVEQP